jgi:hypothetical protein
MSGQRFIFSFNQPCQCSNSGSNTTIEYPWGWDIQAYMRYCVTPSNYWHYPRIHCWESVSRRVVGPRWHDDVACTRQCVIFRNEVGSHQRARCQRQIIAACLPAFVYLKRAGKQRLIGCLHVRQLALIWGRCLRWCSEARGGTAAYLAEGGRPRE